MLRVRDRLSERVNLITEEVAVDLDRYVLFDDLSLALAAQSERRGRKLLNEGEGSFRESTERRGEPRL